MNIPHSYRRKPACFVSKTLRIITSLVTGIYLGLAGLALQAQEKNGSTGTVEGRVYNGNSGLYMNNARVFIKNTPFETYTNDAGEYTLNNVPAGDVDLSVEYSGQTTLTKVVKIVAGEKVKRHFTFNPAVSENESDTDSTFVLDTFVVEQKRLSTARERALQEERAATNIKSVVASDSLGYNPDGNVGEFVRFLAGVDVSEGGTYNNPSTISGVSVRGFGADSTGVYIDGMPLASASGASLTRATQIDMVSINNADLIEVIKVATPDMRQDSPGGAINLISRGAFELAKPSYRFSTALNGQLDTLSLKKTEGPFKNSGIYTTLPSVRFSATVPLSKTMGFSASVASDNRTTATESANAKSWIFKSISPTVRNANGIVRIDNPVASGFQIYTNNWLEYRQSGNLRFDWRPVSGLTIKANGQFSKATTWSADRRNQFAYRNNANITDWGTDGSYVTGGAASLQQTIVTRDKSGFTNSGYLQLDYKAKGWTVGAKLSASESYGAYDDVKNGHFSGMDSTNLYSTFMNIEGIKDGAPTKITMWDSVGNEINYSRISSWGNSNRNFRVQSGEAYSRDLTKQYQFDIGRDLDFMPFRSEIKVGIFRGEKSNHKWGRGTNWYYQYLGPALTADQISTDFMTPRVGGLRDRQQWVDTYKIYSHYQQNPADFDDSWVDAATNTNYQANNHNSKTGQTKGLTEASNEWYVRFDAHFFSNRLNMITGYRESRRSINGYNLFRDSKYAFVRLPDGSLYRDSTYVNGVRFDGNSYQGATKNAAGLYDNVITDAALRTRMLAAGVVEIPDSLALRPDGKGAGSTGNNLILAQRYNKTRYVNTSSKNPGTPQIQLSYKISDNLRVQGSWSRETRLPDLEGGTGTLLNSGGDFQVSENDTTSDAWTQVGGQGMIKISNVKNQPEITNSYNLRLAYDNKYGSYNISYYLKITPNQWVDEIILPGDSDYDSYITAAGLEPSYYNNMTITTSTATGEKGKREGWEVEANQNFGFLGKIGERFDAQVSYTYRSVTANSLSNSVILGYSRQNPVRPVWSGRVSYSTGRYRILAKWKYTQPGRTSMTSTSVTLPDGTNSNVMFYTPNNNEAKVGLQFNYIIDKHFTCFTSVDNIFDSTKYSRKTDSETGYMPHYAQVTKAQRSSPTIAAGIEAAF